MLIFCPQETVRSRADIMDRIPLIDGRFDGLSDQLCLGR